jgi:histidine triad (HIT) family protein
MMNDCIFCQIIAKQIPSELIKETPDYIVIKDIAPKAPTHLLIISKKHITSLNAADDADQNLLGAMLLASKSLAAQFGLSKRGFKVVINTGQEGGQLVPHLHVHFLGGVPLNFGV